jgi:hypothetical protein
VVVSAVTEFGDIWMQHALPDQRRFISLLRAQKTPVRLDVLPFNRFGEMMANNFTDCVLSTEEITYADSILSKSRIVFELRLFHRRGIDLGRVKHMQVGILANLPPIELPVSFPVTWVQLKDSRQAIDLVERYRIEAMVGDTTHISMLKSPNLVMADVPVLKKIELALICRDTPRLRDFVSAFDTSMGVLKSGLIEDADNALSRRTLAEKIW